MSTAYDVFRRLPIARTVQPMAAANEREEVQALRPHIPSGGVLLFERGDPSYDRLDHLQRQDQGGWGLRCPASSTLPAVESFIHSGQAEATLTLSAPKAPPIQLRAIRLVSPAGDCSVLLTNLQDDGRVPAQAIIDLSWRRWAVEGHYREEKTGSYRMYGSRSMRYNGNRYQNYNRWTVYGPHQRDVRIDFPPRPV